MTIIDGSDMTWPWVATRATPYGSIARGVRANRAVMAALRNPERSATPTAMSIAITVPSGGNSTKF